MAVRNAASVFPEPVGAATRVCRPALISGQAPACAAVGVLNLRSNQSATAVWNKERRFTNMLWIAIGKEMTPSNCCERRRQIIRQIIKGRGLRKATADRATQPQQVGGCRTALTSYSGFAAIRPQPNATIDV